MTDLSPAAREVIESVTLKQYNLPLERVPDLTVRKWSIAVSAALRAAADQVAPSDLDEPRNCLPMAMECQRIRKELLAIAAELEGQ